MTPTTTRVHMQYIRFQRRFSPSPDGFHVREDWSVVHGCTVLDPYDSKKYSEPHRDGIQLIPRRRYALGVLDAVTISLNRIDSGNKMQPIFASDGLFTRLVIKNNRVRTESAHAVTINGLISGEISDNVWLGGGYCPVRLYPGRVGGNPPDPRTRQSMGNLWVLSVKQPEYAYCPLSSIIKDTRNTRVYDYRYTGPAYLPPGDILLYDFDLEAFWKATESAEDDVFAARAAALQYSKHP